jgi:hypothetical protein
MSCSQGGVPSESALSSSRSNGIATAATEIDGLDSMVVRSAPLYVRKRHRRGRKRNDVVIERESGLDGEMQRGSKRLSEGSGGDRGILGGAPVESLIDSNVFAADIIAGEVDGLGYFPGLEGDVVDVYDNFMKEDFNVLVHSLAERVDGSHHLHISIDSDRDDGCLPSEILSNEVFEMMGDDGMIRMDDYDHFLGDMIQDRLEQQEEEEILEMKNKRRRKKKNSNRRKRRGSKRKRCDEKPAEPPRRSARLSVQTHLVNGRNPSKENILITPISEAITREGIMECDLISTPVATPHQYIPKTFYYECGAQWTRPPFRVISPKDLDKDPGAPTTSYDFLDFLPHLPHQSLLSQCEEKDDGGTYRFTQIQLIMPRTFVSSLAQDR